MKYNSLARSGFEAYQLNFDNYNSNKTHRWVRELPTWLSDMIETQKFYCTVNAKQKLAYVINDHGKLEVHPTMWIVRNSDGFVFVMPDELFKASFVPERCADTVEMSL